MSRRQKGFTLLELLVAMMILAVLGTIGFQQIRKHTDHARWLKAQDDLKVVSDGLAGYYMRHGHYPVFSNYGAMVDQNSPLVKESLIKTNMSADDPFGEPYEGKSSANTFELSCKGSTSYPNDYGPFSQVPDQGLVTSGTTPASPADTASDKAPSAAPAGKGK